MVEYKLSAKNLGLSAVSVTTIFGCTTIIVAVSLVKLLSLRALSVPMIDTKRNIVVFVIDLTANATLLVTLVNVSFLVLLPALYITVNGPIPAVKLKVSKGVSVSKIGPLPFIEP